MVAKLPAGHRGTGGALSSGTSYWNSTTKIAEIDAYTGTGVNSGVLTFSTTDSGSFAEAMRIDQTGNVGIGTTAPTQKLEVAGNIKMTGTGNGVLFPDGTTQTTAYTGGGSGDFLANGSVPMTGAFQLGSNLITNSGGAYGMSIDTSGRATITNLSGSVANSLVLINSSPSASSGSAISFKSSSVQTAAIGTTIPTSTSDVDLTFSTRGSNAVGERMRIAGNGNVGIGTTAPTRLLHVQSTASTIANFYGADGSQNGINIGVGPNNRWTIYQDTGGNGRFLGIWRDHSGAGGSSGAVATFTDAGNVGIGTVTPSEPLEVNGTAKATQFNGSAAGLTGIAGLFQRITATRSTSAGSSAVTSCPAGYTLIDWNIYNHRGPAYDSGSGWNYCTCSQSGNGIVATLNIANSNANFACGCSGLCAKD